MSVTRIRKDYSSRFLLDGSKLARLVDVIHERIKQANEGSISETFEVFLTGNQHEQLTKVEDVIGLENTSKRAIQRLVITCSAGTVCEVQVDFEALRTTAASGGTPPSTHKVIEVTVRGLDSSWTTSTLSSVEEQLERTFVRDAPVQWILVLILMLGSLFLLSLFFELRPQPQDVGRSAMWLRSSDLDRVQQILSKGSTITDEEMREIVTIQLRNVLEDQRPGKPAQPPRRLRGLEVWTAAAFLLIILGSALVLLVTCYPSAVFRWGDGEARYDRILRRRKVLWGVLSAAFVGVAVNLFTSRGALVRIPE